MQPCKVLEPGSCDGCWQQILWVVISLLTFANLKRVLNTCMIFLLFYRNVALFWSSQQWTWLVQCLNTDWNDGQTYKKKELWGTNSKLGGNAQDCAKMYKFWLEPWVKYPASLVIWEEFPTKPKSTEGIWTRIYIGGSQHLRLSWNNLWCLNVETKCKRL